MISTGPIAAHRLGELPVGLAALSTAEADARRRRYGTNEIVPDARHGWLELARDTARDPMLWFLIGVAALYVAIGQASEALPLLVAIVPLVGMDAFLHRRTRVSTSGLESRLASRAVVERDGVAADLPAVALVPGDLVHVEAGAPFPADGIILAGDGLKVDESSLTGESFPARKRALLVTDGTLPPDVGEEHWGRAGTHVLTGSATVRVVYTGGETLYGEIARSAMSGAQARTPLQAAIAALVSVLVGGALLLCVVLAVVRLVQGHGVVDAIVSALTLAIAAMPEEFPVVFTFFLGVGVYRLARVQALVRRGVSVENIGRVTCICSDKTGTITEGRLALTHLHPAPGRTDADLLALAACTSAASSTDALDTAIRGAALVHGVVGDDPDVRAAFPFDEERRRGTIVLRRDAGDTTAVTKGSPESILALCPLSADARRTWSDTAERLAADGHKVIGCATRTIDEASWPGGEPDRGFEMAGLLAFEDPVREGVEAAVAACRRAGIRTVIVTGDHPATGSAVAREIGLADGTPRVVIADDVLTVDREITPDALAGVDVIARAVPMQKLALVQALQRGGDIVAVTGDGVNDVPALQAADVGVAMGARATRSARDVAAIVLLDDNFRTIVRAVAEAQQLFRNLQSSFAYLLMVHLPLVITAALIPLAGYPLLYLPIHIVWLELVIHPTALLAFQDPAPAGDPRPPRRGRRLRFFDRRQWLGILGGGALLTVAVTVGFMRSVSERNDVGHGRAMALAMLTFASAAAAARLSRLATMPARVIVLATALSTVLVIESPLGARLALQPLHWDDWMLAALIAVATAIVTPAPRGR
ncbi:cation-transporting P-type ATPase [Candidatus Binatia bacterium]|nr:cation-transporting P-type ATPase [Candidatus Binatia bacterium]